MIFETRYKLREKVSSALESHGRGLPAHLHSFCLLALDKLFLDANDYCVLADCPTVRFHGILFPLYDERFGKDYMFILDVAKAEIGIIKSASIYFTWKDGQLEYANLMWVDREPVDTILDIQWNKRNS